ncbi:Diadenylate cyclase (c-di-AMP synthetase), DisA_N domain [Verrucomicrobium sp. GAS474]|uniref:diadenylate cyclase n=1 Tax=Verrucomicrobium sp. GAS474 TaxID=1882831 RepID=UPI000879798F|nr:diadenylate cyclase [Verrucomicrobium sp. GAS474]SDT86835.1 Diadenylate cyclase (c-di-AMP synthetase), DisA_N domain [Verrucomicrobium sp. GAS474]
MTMSFLVRLLGSVSLSVIADIVLCVLIFRIMFGWIFSNPRLGRFVGILLGFAAFFFTIQKFELPVTQILVAALIVPTVALVVLSFLPDLRRAWQTATLRQLFGHRPVGGNNPIPALSSALAELVRIRRGTILIFPKGDDVDSFLNGGEEYDSLVTKSLLLSLLHPGCPRHDGAIVILRDRIVRVGAVLPLSDGTGETPVRDEWGTRHLAALGLSEHCDADILVVSEERGVLSHARQGRLAELASVKEEDIARFLGEILRVERRRTSTRDRWLSRSAWAGAVLVALIAVPTVNWLNKPVHAARVTNLNVVQAPINFANVPDDLYIDSGSEALRADVFLRVPNNEDIVSGRSIDDAVHRLNITVDLQNAHAGALTMDLTSHMASELPPGWEIESYRPQQLKLTLVEAQSRTFPIVPAFVGLEKGMRVAQVVSIVPNVLSARIKDKPSLYGPTVKTLPVNLDGYHRPGTYTLPIALDLPPTIRPPKNFPATVKVTVRLEKP